MDRDRGEVALPQQPVQLLCTADRLDEDADLSKQGMIHQLNPTASQHLTHLVELEVVQEVIQLSVLAVLLKLDVVLLQTVQGKLGLVVNEDLKRL